ncbi:MAG: hypothetical protein KAR00_00775 [Candidatus Pacebacteria bacterium]|nr:hypothetical protein [Candidatus Paceibacterota bacterium]
MEETTIIQTIERTVRELVNEQRNHLKRGRVERTFTTDFASKLKPPFETENITVDPFYNRHGEAEKRLNGGIIELDIAIQERGIDPNNLVAIEIETLNKPKRDDIEKLKGLTRKGGGYEYKLGLFLVVGISEKAGEILVMEWYKNGKLL